MGTYEEEIQNDRKLKALEDAYNEHQWALAVLNDPMASVADVAKATPIVDAQQAIWDRADERMDAIMDIEDDDEREKAWEQWEKDDLAGK